MAEPNETGKGPAGRPRSSASSVLGVATALFLLLAMAAVALALNGSWGGWSELAGEARGYGWKVRPAWLLLSLACGVSALLLTGRVWADLFRRAGGRTTAPEATAAWLGSNLGRYLPGKVWQLTSLAAYLRARGDSGAAAFAVSLVLQAVLLASGAAIGVALTGVDALGGSSPLALVLALFAVAAALHPGLQARLTRLGARLLREDASDASGRVDRGGLLRAGASAVVVWALYGIGFWALVRGLAGGSPVSPLGAVGVFAAGYVIGYLVLLAPGGIVVREGAIAGLLSGVGGIPLGPAAALALAARLWTTSAELAAFGLAAGAGLRSRGRSG